MWKPLVRCWQLFPLEPDTAAEQHKQGAWCLRAPPGPAGGTLSQCLLMHSRFPLLPCGVVREWHGQCLDASHLGSFVRWFKHSLLLGPRPAPSKGQQNDSHCPSLESGLGPLMVAQSDQPSGCWAFTFTPAPLVSMEGIAQLLFISSFLLAIHRHFCGCGFSPRSVHTVLPNLQPQGPSRPPVPTSSGSGCSAPHSTG